MTQPEATKSVRRYIDVLKQHHVPVERVFIFGSVARGTNHEWSDIDVGVVSQKFKTNRFDEMIELQHLAKDVDPALSPVPLRPEDLDDRFDTIAEAIRREGKEIKF